MQSGAEEMNKEQIPEGSNMNNPGCNPRLKK
jgi:hypothetical protein